LRAACAALLKENGGVLAQEIERGFSGKFFAFERRISTVRGDSASGTGAAVPSTTMVSERTGMGVEGVWA